MQKMETDKKINIILSKEFYEKEAILSAIHKFENIVYTQVHPINEKEVNVKFENKNSSNLEYLKKEFLNEVLDQQVRLDLEKRFGHIRDLIYRHAFSPVKSVYSELEDDD